MEWSLVCFFILSTNCWVSMSDQGASYYNRRLKSSPTDDPRFQLSKLEELARNINAESARGNNYIRKTTPSSVIKRRQKRQSGGSSQFCPFTEPAACDDVSDEFRTFDGKCNNLKNPILGAAHTPLARLMPANYADGVSSPIRMHSNSTESLPSARMVSATVTSTLSSLSGRHSHLLMGFGQFLDHDVTLTPTTTAVREGSSCCQGKAGLSSSEDGPEKSGNSTSERKECFPILVSNDNILDTECIPFVRSAAVPNLDCTPGVREQMNDLTSFIDGSQVYGSSKRMADSLRSFERGQLLSWNSNNETVLPLTTQNERMCNNTADLCAFQAGDVRSSEHAGLSSVQSLFLREHNRVAENLAFINSNWTDEQLYQVSRKIVGAMLQHITYNEFLPEIIGPTLLEEYSLTLVSEGFSDQYDENTDPRVLNEFATAAFRFGHTLVRQNFYIPQEDIYIDTETMFRSYHMIKSHGCNSFLMGQVEDQAENFDPQFSNTLRNHLFGEELDLMALNIQRGRDHGLPSYNQVRDYFGLENMDSWSKMLNTSINSAPITGMQQMYHSTEDIELFPGGLMEPALPDAVVGETFGNVIALQFKLLKEGDRFWYERNDTTAFTEGQLAEIRRVSMASLFCRNLQLDEIRPALFRLENAQNQAVPCTDIPELDFSQWKD